MSKRKVEKKTTSGWQIESGFAGARKSTSRQDRHSAVRKLSLGDYWRLTNSLRENEKRGICCRQEKRRSIDGEERRSEREKPPSPPSPLFIHRIAIRLDLFNRRCGAALPFNFLVASSDPHNHSGRNPLSTSFAVFFFTLSIGSTRCLRLPFLPCIGSFYPPLKSKRARHDGWFPFSCSALFMDG